MKLEVFKGCVLHSGYPWVEHKFGDRDAILDGRFTSDELREIADAMDDKKRPADVIANAIKVARIATGEEPEEIEKTDDGKDAAAVSMGRRGGKARAQKMTAERRSEIAKAAAARRWKKQDCT